LWQLSYSELTFTQTLWPDFTPNELENIINEFEQRKRRFGGI
jgi:undecaprenyl diphosphate synthase